MKSTFSIPCVLLFLSAGLVQAAPRYSVTDLGTLGGLECNATALNNKGQITGISDTSVEKPDTTYVMHVFVWQNGKIRPLGPREGQNYAPSSLNDKGQVAGVYHDTTHGTFRAFTYQNGKVRLLPALPHKGKGFSFSAARGLGLKGQVVGSSDNRACLWNGGRLMPLTVPVGFGRSEAFGINSMGLLVGTGDTRIGFSVQSHALLWQGGKPRDLGVLPGFRESTARGINNSGQVVGWSSSTQSGPQRFLFRYHAFVWQKGHLRDLGTVPRLENSRAVALNDRGEIVGTSNSKREQHAILWRGGKAYDLNALIPPGTGWVLRDAIAINNRGWIIGNGKHKGIFKAFVLKPLGGR